MLVWDEHEDLQTRAAARLWPTDGVVPSQRAHLENFRQRVDIDFSTFR